MAVEFVKKQADQKGGQGKSKIAYPYNDLNASIDVARAIKNKGGGACNPDQLATFLDYSSAGTGTYNNRVSAAKTFGLIQSDRQSYTITERAERILSPVMPEDEATARMEAFFDVPLFKVVYDNVGGKMLPPEAGMKNLLVRLGVLEERAAPAYRILMDSADQAGLFAAAGDRSKMVKPHAMGGAGSSSSKPGMDAPPPASEKQKGGGGGEPPGGIHTAIVGLLRELPQPGTAWPPVKKKRFLGAFEAILNVVYQDEGEDST